MNKYQSWVKGAVCKSVGWDNHQIKAYVFDNFEMRLNNHIATFTSVKKTILIPSLVSALIRAYIKGKVSS